MTRVNLEIASILRENGLRVTKPRLLVFARLIGSEPLSMHELYLQTRKHMDRASLYRTISTFESLGIVQRVNIGWKYKLELTDKYAEHHHHLTCLKCGRVIPLNEQVLENFVVQAAKQKNFHATDHQVEIQGYCSKCKSNRNFSEGL